MLLLGAAVLVLEDLQHALDRGANIYAEITGYGVSSDAYDPVRPDEDGAGAARAVAWAMEDAGVAPEEVDYINAHGTSTPQGDACETQAIKSVFGDHAHRLAVSSTKGATGHMLGAAGGVEMAVCCKALETDTVPPTINYETPDPECNLDYIPNEAREAPVQRALSNSFGFGGTNCTLVFRRFTG